MTEEAFGHKDSDVDPAQRRPESSESSTDPTDVGRVTCLSFGGCGSVLSYRWKVTSTGGGAPAARPVSNSVGWWWGLSPCRGCHEAIEANETPREKT